MKKFKGTDMCLEISLLCNLVTEVKITETSRTVVMALLSYSGKVPAPTRGPMCGPHTGPKRRKTRKFVFGPMLRIVFTVLMP